MMVLSRMPMFAQFELIEPIHDDIVNTWLAREPGSGRLLLLHKFSRASGLREKIRTMNPPDLGMLVKAGEEAGLFYVVTYDRPELRHFREWVESRSKLKAAGIYPPSVEHADPAKTGLWKPAVTAPGSTSEPGEFTRMFEVQPPKPEPPKPEGPGEFTRMFQTSPQSPTAPAAQPDDQDRTRTMQIPAWVVATTAHLEAKKTESTPRVDEFTGAFGRPLGEPRPQAPPEAFPEAVAESGPGEFTQMFIAKPVEPSAQGEPAVAEPVRQEPEAPARSGEFTSMFSAPPQTKEPAPAPPAGAATGEPGEFTRMFQQPTPNSPPSSVAPAAPAANARINEAGEFTRMFQQPTVNTPPPANPQRPQAPGDDFTKFFGNQMPSTPLAENLDRPSVIPPGPPPEAGSFTRILGAMDTAPPTRAPASGATAIFSSPAQPASAPAPSAAGPGEYTRLFPAPAATPPESPASPAAGATTSPAPASKSEAKAPASPSAVAKTGDYTALIIILAVLALIAIGLILYFLLRK